MSALYSTTFLRADSDVLLTFARLVRRLVFEIGFAAVGVALGRDGARVAVRVANCNREDAVFTRFDREFCQHCSVRNLINVGDFIHICFRACWVVKLEAVSGVLSSGLFVLFIGTETVNLKQTVVLPQDPGNNTEERSLWQVSVPD